MIDLPQRWDIFCKIVDNYGDAGVAWRLARLLAGEHGLAVTLWLDRLDALARIVPTVNLHHDPRPSLQSIDGVSLRSMDDATIYAEPAAVVVDAFGGGLPQAYVEAMLRSPAPPAWFILEYLSAESWVDDAHGRASPHPTLALARRFWFPGFTPHTGGLLREHDLFNRRDAFRADSAAQAQLWAKLGLPPASDDGLRVSIFCYPDAPLPALLDAWTDVDTELTVLLPEGIASGKLDAWSGGALPHPGGPPLRHGRLQLHAIPWLAQDDYDCLLWACDVNFVRGEDSFVRAQWAARPFVWQPYPQDDGAHEIKLAAFLDRYTAGLDAADKDAVNALFSTWSGVSWPGVAWPSDFGSGVQPDARSRTAIASAWTRFVGARERLDRHGEIWAAQLAGLPELAAGLVKTAQKLL